MRHIPRTAGRGLRALAAAAIAATLLAASACGGDSGGASSASGGDGGKVTLRFTYDPATKQVAYRDARVGKKTLTDKDDKTVLLASTYEVLKARADAAQAKADAKAKAKAKKKKDKDKVAHNVRSDSKIIRS